MRVFIWAIALMCLGLCGSHAAAQSFTYQGRLTSGGAPANGPHDLRFTLYTQPTGGTPVSSTVCLNDIEVVDGVFTVTLPITVPTTMSDLYLGVDVRADLVEDCSQSSGFFPLLPRQIVSPAPKALMAGGVTTDSIARDGGIRVVPGERAIEIYDQGWWFRLTAVQTPTPPRASAQFNVPGVFEFVVPANAHHIWVNIHGGAGGGGDRGGGNTALPTECQSGFGTYSVGGGGGASGSAAQFLMHVTPGETLTITVGSGGASGVSTNGGAGGVSRIRRANNTVDIVTAPGGAGGGRRNTAVTMGADTSASGCVGQAAGGSGGAPGVTATFGDPAAVDFTTAAGGNAGLAGVGPSCYDGTPDGFCAAQGGAGGAGVDFFVPLAPIGSMGSNGGSGAGPTTSATAGGPGKVHFWWD